MEQTKLSLSVQQFIAFYDTKKEVNCDATRKFCTDGYMQDSESGYIFCAKRSMQDKCGRGINIRYDPAAAQPSQWWHFKENAEYLIMREAYNKEFNIGPRTRVSTCKVCMWGYDNGILNHAEQLQARTAWLGIRCPELLLWMAEVTEIDVSDVAEKAGRIIAIGRSASEDIVQLGGTAINTRINAVGLIKEKISWEDIKKTVFDWCSNQE